MDDWQIRHIDFAIPRSAAASLHCLSFLLAFLARDIVCLSLGRGKQLCLDFSPKTSSFERNFIFPFYFFYPPKKTLVIDKNSPSEIWVGDVELCEDGNPWSTRVEYHLLQRGQRGKDAFTHKITTYDYTLVLFLYDVNSGTCLIFQVRNTRLILFYLRFLNTSWKNLLFPSLINFKIIW